MTDPLLFDSRIDPSKATELPDGSARLDVRLAPQGETFKNGPSTFTLTQEDLTAAVANFNKRGAPAPVTLGHYPMGHTPAPEAAAWIERLFKQVTPGQTYLSATMRFLKDTWAAIKADKFKFLSMEFYPASRNQKGEPIGFEIDGAAIVNDAFFPLRFDQRSSRGDALLWLSRFGCAAGDGDGSDPEGKTDIDLSTGLEIRPVGEQFCIFNAAGERLGTYDTREQADAALATMTGRCPDEEKAAMGKKIEVEEIELTKLKAEREELLTLKKAAAGKTSVDEAELTKLRKDREELEALRKKGDGSDGKGGDVVKLQKDLDAEKADRLKLEKTVKELEDGRKADQKKLTAGRIRSAVTKLMKEHGVHVKLGDHKIETDEGALAYLGTKPFGVESVEGLEKLSSDIEASAHLPHVRLGDERSSGASGATGEPQDLSTKEGRTEAVRQRVVALRKEFPGEALERHLKIRGQTAEEFARQELRAEHSKIDWSKD